MKGRNIPYSTAERAWIKANAHRPRREAHGDFTARFGRDDVSLDNFKSLCTREGWLNGATGRFSPGQRPHNTRHLGHERLTHAGYVEISVPERNPYTGYPRRYVHKHRWLWEQAHGPIPENHVLKCLDGDKSNTDPTNWEAIPRSLLPRLNGRFGRNYDSAPAELKPTILAIAKLEHAARTAKGD